MPSGIYIRSENTKDILREASKLRKEKFGYLNSPATRKKLKILNLGEKNPNYGKHHTEKEKIHLSKVLKGKKKPEGFNIGRKITWGDKISKSCQGRKLSKEHFQKLQEGRKKLICPKKDTSIEVKIQGFLKEIKIEFLTHQYVHIEHGYQCDIFIPVQEGIIKKTIIECFGTYWHNYPLSREIDIQRNNELRNKGWRVLVFWENEIKAMQLNDLKTEVIQR